MIPSEHPPLKGRLRGPFSFCEIAVRKRRRITRAQLRELLRYNRKTGEFRWLRRLTTSAHIGEIAGAVNNQGYRRITIKGQPYLAHHLAWLYVKGKWCQRVIDHQDGDPSNNRWSNLRSATRSQSNANRRIQRNNACGLKGVSRDGGRWYARINKNGEYTVLVVS
jgi:hypothetical protein